MYAHHAHFGARRGGTLVDPAIVGTGLGGGVITWGACSGERPGWQASSARPRSRIRDLLEDDQPIPRCNCGLTGDVESVASLTGIELNLLPYWLTEVPGPRAGRAATRACGEAGAWPRRATATRWP